MVMVIEFRLRKLEHYCRLMDLEPHRLRKRNTPEELYWQLMWIPRSAVLVRAKDHRIHNKTKRPKVGKHWTFAICGKHLLQTFLIHYLCWQVLEPEPHVAKERVSDRELNKPEGVIHWCKRTIAWLLCQQYEEQWLSTFFIDHMLLVIVGLPYCFLQLMLAFVHVNMRESGIEMEGALKEDTQIFIAGIFSLYAGFNMVGFLCVTLGNGVRPRQGYAYVFQVLTLVLAVVMALEFLVQQQYRQRYSQFQFRDVIDNYGKMRLFMSASQLFATHGLFMLCAMHLGHAQHFERCPDLPWRKAATKALGCLLLMICIICAGYANRTGHSWPRCGSVRFAIAAWYECTAQASEVFVGLLLLSVGLRQTSERVELGATEWKLLPAMMAFFDFDSFLILVTFTASIGFKLAETFNYFAEKMMISWSLSVASTASSVGLAVFTFACWRNPPLHGFPRFCLWIALLYTFHGFIDFQFFEDCEFTSSTPGCCDFPGLRDVVGEGKEAWQRCALDDRCDIAHTVPNRGNETFYCALPHHHGHGQAKDHAQPHHTAHLHQISFRSTLSKEKCDKLHQRWRAFPKDLKIAELSEEEESFSTAFIQLKTVGSAGNIEFHFAIIGILLKVILFVEHPNSVTILQQRRRHEQARLSRHAL
ncbi:unnamed protein product [Symbiodinium sp. CCMP2592]|nr:unnamed protein product [Symbiodinium sp. CCMP2592]